MSTLELTQSIGMEIIGKQTLAILREELNDEIDAQQARWNVLDNAFGIPLITVERIKGDHFYHGHRPSLIDAPVENYPNVSVLAYKASPAVSLFDHENRSNVTMYVEIMCKSDEDEGEVNSRITRTADAAHIVLMRNPTLKGLVAGIQENADIVLTDVFARPETRGHGTKFIWQGARLEYVVEKTTPHDT